MIKWYATPTMRKFHAYEGPKAPPLCLDDQVPNRDGAHMTPMEGNVWPDKPKCRNCERIEASKTPRDTVAVAWLRNLLKSRGIRHPISDYSRGYNAALRMVDEWLERKVKRERSRVARNL